MKEKFVAPGKEPAAPFGTLKWIVLAPAHSGTGYAARVLTSLGVVCGHEHLYRPKAVRANFGGCGPWGHSWFHVQAESAWPAAHHLGHKWMHGAHIIHLLRNPLHVVESLWRKRGGDKSVKGLHGALSTYYEKQKLISNARVTHPDSFCGYTRVCVEHGPVSLAAVVGRAVDRNTFDKRDYNSHMHGSERKLTSWDVVSMRTNNALEPFRAWQRIWERAFQEEVQ